MGGHFMFSEEERELIDSVSYNPDKRRRTYDGEYYEGFAMGLVAAQTALKRQGIYEGMTAEIIETLRAIAEAHRGR